MNLINKIYSLFNISNYSISLLQNLECNICFFCDKCNYVINEIIKELIKPDFLDNKFEVNNIMIMNIITGMGGEDAQEISNQILNVYFRSFSMIDNISIYDKNNIVFTNYKLFNLLSKYEKCVYKVVRISPFSNKKQTSYIGISFDTYKDNSFNININDIDFKYTRSSGSGGQHVNKTNSCVIAKHIPTNISVKVSQERNQIQNKSLAIKLLNYKINKYLIDKNKNNKKNNYIYEQKISFGSNFNRYINLHKDKFFKIKNNNFKININYISDLYIIPIFFRNIIDSN
ncbi:peptide chain release factor 2 [uncultured bacterium]|nr:peptide chain release factor 2 [uncultured bacterium]